MFTGIVEEVGIIKMIEQGEKSTRLTIQAEKVLTDLKHGDSVSTNGVCLTVSLLQGNTFKADVMAQSLRNTILGNLKVGDRVNLERALQLSTRLGGHIVSGHVDCVGEIISVHNEDIARWIKIALPLEQMKYIVEKGSVCIDGVSLTVAKLEDSNFSVSTIPVTREDTVLSKRGKGDKVNIEFDVIAKYTERLLNFGNNNNKEKKTKIDENFLRQNGFL